MATGAHRRQRQPIAAALERPGGIDDQPGAKGGQRVRPIAIEDHRGQAGASMDGFELGAKAVESFDPARRQQQIEPRHRGQHGGQPPPEHARRPDEKNAAMGPADRHRFCGLWSMKRARTAGAGTMQVWRLPRSL